MQPLQWPLGLIGCIALYYFACCCLIYICANIVMPSFPAFCCSGCLPFIYISLVYLLHQCLPLRQMDVSTNSKRHRINIVVPGRSHPGSTDRHWPWKDAGRSLATLLSKESLFQIQIHLFRKDELFKSLRPSKQTTINSAGNQINSVILTSWIRLR